MLPAHFWTVVLMQGQYSQRQQQLGHTWPASTIPGDSLLQTGGQSLDRFLQGLSLIQVWMWGSSLDISRRVRKRITPRFQPRREVGKGGGRERDGGPINGVLRFVAGLQARRLRTRCRGRSSVVERLPSMHKAPCSTNSTALTKNPHTVPGSGDSLSRW